MTTLQKLEMYYSLACKMNSVSENHRSNNHHQYLDELEMRVYSLVEELELNPKDYVIEKEKINENNLTEIENNSSTKILISKEQSEKLDSEIFFLEQNIDMIKWLITEKKSTNWPSYLRDFKARTESVITVMQNFE